MSFLVGSLVIIYSILVILIFSRVPWEEPAVISETVDAIIVAPILLSFSYVMGLLFYKVAIAIGSMVL